MLGPALRGGLGTWALGMRVGFVIHNLGFKAHSVLCYS